MKYENDTDSETDFSEVERYLTSITPNDEDPKLCCNGWYYHYVFMCMYTQNLWCIVRDKA